VSLSLGFALVVPFSDARAVFGDAEVDNGFCAGSTVIASTKQMEQYALHQPYFFFILNLLLLPR
jgi:hypothetical protein